MIAEACVMAFDCLGNLSVGALALLCVAGGVAALAWDERQRKLNSTNRNKSNAESQ